MLMQQLKAVFLVGLMTVSCFGLKAAGANHSAQPTDDHYAYSLRMARENGVIGWPLYVAGIGLVVASGAWHVHTKISEKDAMTRNAELTSPDSNDGSTADAEDQEKKKDWHKMVRRGMALTGVGLLGVSLLFLKKRGEWLGYAQGLQQ